ncbi:MAG TPA: hypothetical protein VJ860_17505 [Polyangia bacterium]|jgi:hypothetical protein|nr:hypothetical protein [Polyangia bacterium]
MGNTTIRRLADASGAARWTSSALRVVLIGAVLAASAAPVLGQEDERAVTKIIDLNKKALVQIDAKKFDAARDGLVQAVIIAKQANLLTHKMLARTYVHLGAVYFLGYNDNKNAVKYFGLGKGIRADILLTPSLATQNLTAIFDKAPADKGQPDDPWAGASKSGPRSPARATVTAPAPAPPTSAPPPVANKVPELPAVLPADLYCPAVEEAPEGREIVLRCTVKPKLKAERVLLYFRASGAPSYAVAAMQSSPNGWLEASIPAESATGESLQYYCEARDSDDNVVATSGQEDIPNPIILTPATPGETPVGRRVATGGKGDGDDPLQRIKDEQKSEIRELDLHRRRQGAFWLAPGLGTGVGYHLNSALEWRKGPGVPFYKAGFRLAGTLTGYLELGYLITDHIGVAAQGRYEWISSEGSGDQTIGAPASRALSVLGRGLYYLDLGAGNAQLQLSADFGGGDGYRFAFPPTNPSHKPELVDPRNPNSLCRKDDKGLCILQPTLVTDTVRSGPFVYGAGVGFIYHFNSHLAANFELRFLAAGPHFGLLIEGYATVQVALGGKAPDQAFETSLPEEDEEE